MASLPRNKPKTNPPQLKANAQREVHSGRLPQAIELLEELLRQTPDDWPTVQRLADLRARKGDRRAAVDLYRRLANHYEEDGHLARAIAVWRLILRHDPAFLGTHVKLGELYALQGFRVESRRHYETAVAGFQREGRQREAEQVRRALDDTHRATARVPASTDRSPAEEPVDPASLDEAEFVAERLVEAKMFRRYQLLDQARQALDALLHRAPDHADARKELVELLRDAGETERAAEEQRRVATADNTIREVPPETTSPRDPGPLKLDLDFVDEGTRDEHVDEHVADAPEEKPAPEPVVEPRPSPIEDILAEAFETGPTSAAPDPHLARPEGGDGAPRQVPSEEVVRIFREQVDAQLAHDDDEARYDLGIAYREMGLLDEAIVEFQRAARSERRLVECASLLAGCFLEKGLPELAVRWLERGLAAPGRGEEETSALRYELGHALEAAGQGARALEAFTELYGESAGYRDVAARVERLRTARGPAGGTRGGTRGKGP